MNTADGDNIPDLIIGASAATGPPSANGLNQRGLDGGVSIVEGAFIAPLLGVPTPISQITSTIQVDSHNGPPFVVSATTPNTLIIFVFSNANITPTFNPVTALNPATVTVNGVAFPNATISADPIDENNDGIPDAIITISPRSENGPAGEPASPFTLTAKTLANSPFAGQRYSSSTSIVVTNGAVTPGGGGGTGIGGGWGRPRRRPDRADQLPRAVRARHLRPLAHDPLPARHLQADPREGGPPAVPPPGRVRAAAVLLPVPRQEADPTVRLHRRERPPGPPHHVARLQGLHQVRLQARQDGRLRTHKTPVVPVNLQHEQLAGPIAGVTREPAAAKKAAVAPRRPRQKPSRPRRNPDRAPPTDRPNRRPAFRRPTGARGPGVRLQGVGRFRGVRCADRPSQGQGRRWSTAALRNRPSPVALRFRRTSPAGAPAVRARGCGRSGRGGRSGG